MPNALAPKRPTHPTAPPTQLSAICASLSIHEAAISLAREAILDLRTLDASAELFKVLGDPTRVRILAALAAAELCVCDLRTLLGMSQSATSHQLALLRAARLVQARREGKTVYYRLDDDHVRDLLTFGAQHAGEAGFAR